MSVAAMPVENAAEHADRACPACGSRHRSDLGVARDPWRIVRCASCGFIYTNPAPTYEALAGDLSWDKSFDAHAKRKKKERPIIEALDKATRWRLGIFPRTSFAQHLAKQAPPGPVVDVGCGSGDHFDDYADGYIPYGVEIAPALAARAQEKAAAKGGRVEAAPALEGLKRLPDSHFSAALLRSYLEHETQPREVLAEVARILRSDGVAIVKCPNWATINRFVMRAQWCGVRLPDHVNYFTPRSLRALARNVGLTAHFGLGGQFPTNDNLYAMLRKA